MAPGLVRESGRRVVVVDDDEVYRHGVLAVLDADPSIEVVGTLSHTRALHWEGWADADVVIVDAADPRREDDHFPGVGVVRAIRRARPKRGPVVIVVTGHFFDDAVRCRMREAGADFFYYRVDLCEAEALREAVLGTDEAPRGVPPATDPEMLFRIGVTDYTRVNQAVDHALHNGIECLISERADPRSRRWLRLREDFNREADLTPVTADGRQPDRRQGLPSLPQIARFLYWATRVKQLPYQ